MTFSSCGRNVTHLDTKGTNKNALNNINQKKNIFSTLKSVLDSKHTMLVMDTI